jgi:hypothetical protein
MSKIAITGTFLDEITDDIPHQNWSEREWDADFLAMKNMGIKRVFMIRAGLNRRLAYPSRFIPGRRNTYPVYEDLIAMFLRLAEKYEMEFWPGNYVGLTPEGRCFHDLEFDMSVADELWERYGSGSRAFGGWYFSKEIGTDDPDAVEIFLHLARHCKEISDGLPVMISPWISILPEAARNHGGKVREWDETPIDFDAFRKTWDNIMAHLAGAVDIVAWQDGYAPYAQMPQLFKIQKELGEKHGMKVWINTESFDRDMPFRFPPINWNMLRYKLECAAAAGIGEAITFEFSHFMSPNSMWPSAAHLYNRYMEYCGK